VTVGSILADETVGTLRVGDRTVRRLGFGAARVSGARGPDGGRNREVGRSLCRRAYERGVNFFDVASVYGRGECEEILAEALHPYPADLLIASKAGMAAERDSAGRTVTVPDGRPEFIKAECEASLRRLRLDAIDLYQHHSPDPRVPLAESIGAFQELRDEGKIRDVGLSNVSVAQLEEALTIAPIVSVQNMFNVAFRQSEAVLARCEELGIAFIPYSPNLTGDLPVNDQVRRIAAEHGVSAQQVNVAWLLQWSASALPIPGTTKVAHVDDNVDTAWLHLTPDELARLGAA
jgi:aryl-alcohol dehydrogenase-like predicted oxidoreductase